MQAEQLPFLINESIYFDYAPVPTFAGHINRHPFKVNISSSNDNVHIVNLNARYSRSYDAQDKLNKWSFLRPECKFLDINGNKIDSLITNDTRLYKDSNGILNSISGTFVGVSGTCEFYCIDDVYNFDLAYNGQPYTTIVATLETSGVNFFDVAIDHIRSSNNSNSKAIACQPHIFQYRQPDFIKISENGIRDFINPLWSAVMHPIIFSLNWNQTYSQLYYDGNEIQPINYNSNFCHFHPLSGEDYVGLNTKFLILSSTVFVSPTSVAYQFDNPTKINYLNSDGYIASGYNKNFFHTPAEDTTIGVYLSATSYFNTPSLTGNNYSPKLWISNPAAGVMSIVENNSINNFPNEDIKNIQKAQLFNFDVPTIQLSDYNAGNNFSLGYHNIESIAVLPFPDFQAWAYDDFFKHLYKFTTNGKIISAVDIGKIINDNNLNTSITNNLTARSIVLDGDKNIWLTDNATNFALKLDNTGSLIATASAQYGIPYSLDTDSNNNIWVTSSTSTNGYLFKYDTNGILLSSISYAIANEIPTEIIINNTDSFWVAVSGSSAVTPRIEKRDTNGILLSSFGPIPNLNKLTLDINQTLWFTCQYGSIGNIDDYSNNYVINVLENSDDTTDVVIPNTTTLQGIACDLKGLIYVINSLENQIYIFDCKTQNFVDKFRINPKGFVFTPTNIYYNNHIKSAQASGDWIGTRWTNKYNSNYGSSLELSLSGISKALDFYAKESTALIPDQAFLSTNYYEYLDTNYYQDILVTPVTNTRPTYLKLNLNVFKINENFDFSAQIKKVAFTPTLQESVYLFNNILPSIFGYFPFNHSDLGVFSYERVSNFVSNHSDVDVCNIDQLYSLANSINENKNDYNIAYPSEIKRLMDILSINQSRLWGSAAKNQNNFNKMTYDGVFNRGELVTLNYQVTAGVPVVLKTISLDKYQLISTGLINSLTSYPLSSLANYVGLTDDWQFYYEFYEFIPQSSMVRIDNIIDFNNPQTTINQNLSTAFSWVGAEQTIDKLFSYELYNGLGLFPF